MEKKVQALALMILLCGLAAYSEGNNAAQKETNASQEEKTVAVQEEKSDTEETHKKKSLVQVASSVFQPLPEADEKEVSGGRRFINVMGNFLMGKYPLTIDFGAEPKERGSLVFGKLQYNWNKKYASAIKITYINENETEDSGSRESYLVHITRQKKNIRIQMEPFIRYFGDSSVNAESPLFVLRLGLMADLYNGDIDGIRSQPNGFDTYAANQKVAMLAPYLGIDVFLPFLKYFEFYSGTNIAPLLGEMEKISYEEFSKNAVNPEPFKMTGTRTLHTISTPVIQQNFACTLFRYIRLNSQLNFQRLVLSLPGTDDETYNQYKTTLKYGIEVILPSKTARRGDNHLWAGLYYQHSWLYTTDTDTLSRTGKFVLAFGT
ncbi:MAG: hypothetical protein II684_04660 [Treponema sp.]|nr:hypothetical protein [Treponema sp.]